MGVAHVGLVHRDPCEYKVKGFCAVSFIERNVSKRRHLQGVGQTMSIYQRKVEEFVFGRRLKMDYLRFHVEIQWL